MPTKLLRLFVNDGDGYIDVPFADNGDGTNSPAVALGSGGGVAIDGSVELRSDLRIGAKSVTLTMSTGTGSVYIPAELSIVGVKPVSTDVMRVGLEAPEAKGTKTGAAAEADLKKGVPDRKSVV